MAKLMVDRDSSTGAASAIEVLTQDFTVSQADLLVALAIRLQEGRGFAVATPNLDHVVKLRRDPGFREVYARQTHIVADGNPIVWLQRLAGRPVDLVPGSDLIAPLMNLAARMSATVAFLGSREEVLALAALQLEAAHPGLRVVCRIAPPRDFDPTGRLADTYLHQIAESGARICLLALGAPKQETLAARGLTKIPQCGFVSIGAGLDFIAGTERRAPQWMRRVALEWVWRLMHNWRRMGQRYFECATILPALIWNAWHSRTERGSKGRRD